MYEKARIHQVRIEIALLASFAPSKARSPSIVLFLEAVRPRVQVPKEDLPQMRWKDDYEEAKRDEKMTCRRLRSGPVFTACRKAHRQNRRQLPEDMRPEVLGHQDHSLARRPKDQV